MNQTPERGRFVPGLDGVRAVAVLAVILFHANRLDGSPVPADSAVNAVLSIGWCGVDIFFVLSGFLITGILLDTRSTSGYFSRFYVRRALRIVPAYYLLLVIVFGIAAPIIADYPREWIDAVSSHQWWYWTYLTNWWFVISVGRTLFNTGHLWSLAIEEQFYLVWPLLVWFVSRTSTRPLRWICVGIVIATPIGRWLMLRSGVAPYTIYVATFTRLDGLAAGAWLACIARDGTGLVPLRRWSLPAMIVAAVAVIAIAVGGGSASSLAPGMLTAGLTAIAVAAAAWLVIVCTDDPSSRHARWVSHPWMRSVGKYSYAMYLAHYPLMFLARNEGWEKDWRLMSGTRLPRQVLFTILITAATYGIARLSWIAIEAPALRLKRFVPYPWEKREQDQKSAAQPKRRRRKGRNRSN